MERVVKAAAFAALLSASVLGCPQPPSNPIQYSVITIDTRPGRANDVNAEGVVVGSLKFGTEYHAFMWQWNKKALMYDMGTLGGWESVGHGINDYKQVCGSSVLSYYRHAFLWTGSTGMQDIGPPGANWGSARAINNAGTAAGDYGDAEGYYRACTWTPEHGLAQIPGAERGTHAFDINNWGATVGSLRDAMSYGTPYPPEIRGWEPDGTPMPIANTIGGTAGMAMAINDLSEVVGTAEGEAGRQYAFHWTKDAGMQKLPTLGYCGYKGFCAVAKDINFAGDIVGGAIASTGAEHAVIWRDGAIQDLNDLIPQDTNWEFLEQANAINNKGTIVGEGLLRVDDKLVNVPFMLVPKS